MEDPQRPVLIAEYPFPYLAEFAAGFLRDAEIPHKLDLGDGHAAGIGMVGRGSRLWVRAVDEKSARLVLESFLDSGSD